MKTTARLPGILLGALALALLPATSPAGPTNHDPAFEEAVSQFQQARLSAAYGRFIQLANQGDRDSARIALFLHRYGPKLYGSYWDASGEEVDLWEQLANQGGRSTPVFRTQPTFRPKKH